MVKLLILPVRFSIPGVGVQIESGAAPDTTSKDLTASAAPQTPATDADVCFLFSQYSDEYTVRIGSSISYCIKNITIVASDPSQE